jgi:hypothetical protein
VRATSASVSRSAVVLLAATPVEGSPGVDVSETASIDAVSEVALRARVALARKPKVVRPAAVASVKSFQVVPAAATSRAGD